LIGDVLWYIYQCLMHTFLHQSQSWSDYYLGLQCLADSAGLMPTEARGNYLPEAPYLR